MHFSDSLSSQSICWKEEATMQMSSIRQRREIENGWTGRKWSVRGSREGTVLDAFAKPLETILHNNLLEKWQRDAKMSETTPNSDDFFPLLRST